MERGDVARLLSIADADVESFEENELGLFVDVRDGGRRVVTKDGLFACDDHPANRQLRQWSPVAKPGLILTVVGIDKASEAFVDAQTAAEQLGHTLTALSDKPEESVPDGTAAEVLAWVGGSPERALQAYEVEEKRDKPRSTLLAKLEELVSA